MNYYYNCELCRIIPSLVWWDNADDGVFVTRCIHSSLLMWALQMQTFCASHPYDLQSCKMTKKKTNNHNESAINGTNSVSDGEKSNKMFRHFLHTFVCGFKLYQISNCTFIWGTIKNYFSYHRGLRRRLQSRCSLLWHRWRCIPQIAINPRVRAIRMSCYRLDTRSFSELTIFLSCRSVYCLLLLHRHICLSYSLQSAL